jgi:hypothetical protein
MIINHMGDVVCQGSELKTETISANIDANYARQWQNEFKVLKDMRKEMIGSCKVTKIKA